MPEKINKGTIYHYTIFNNGVIGGTGYGYEPQGISIEQLGINFEDLPENIRDLVGLQGDLPAFGKSTIEDLASGLAKSDTLYNVFSNLPISEIVKLSENEEIELRRCLNPQELEELAIKYSKKCLVKS